MTAKRCPWRVAFGQARRSEGRRELALAIHIQGSSVTRDAVGHFPGDLKVERYLARSSIASLMAPPVVPWFQHGEPPLKFEVKTVLADFQKTWRKSEPTSAVTVYDFIDERFGLLRLPDGGTVTYSTSLRNLPGESETVQSRGQVIGVLRDAYDAAVLGALDGFCDHLTQKGPALVNAVFWAEKDDRGEDYSDWPSGLAARQNTLLSKIYDRIAARTKAVLVSLPREDYIGAHDHRWARAPFHWTIETEKSLGQKITDAVRVIAAEQAAS